MKLNLHKIHLIACIQSCCLLRATGISFHIEDFHH